MEEWIKTLEARIAFLEQWLQIPVVHLPGYVAPDPVAEPEPEVQASMPVEEVPVASE